MDTAQREAKQSELAELRSRVAQLEAELVGDGQRFRGSPYYATYYATAGFFLGMIAAAASLLFNIIGSAVVGDPPLQLIQIYLTFPLGERALTMDSGIALAVGCCLYIGTGMLLGIVFHMALSRWSQNSGLVGRLVLASVLGVVVWMINFYGILSWLQQALFGGNWIVQMVPWYVGMATHLVFGWTMALIYPLGLYRPYQLQTENA